MSEQQAEEIWRPIPNFPGYDASNLGRIRSYWKNTGSTGGRIIAIEPQRILNPAPSHGYYNVGLCCDKGRSTKSVHRLVAAAFLGPCPEGFEVCHNDGTRSNNELSNLRYDTRSENQRDKVRHGRCSSRKLSENQVINMRTQRARGSSLKSLADQFDVVESTISEICSGIRFAWLAGPITKGHRCGPKLNLEKARQVRALHQEGHSYKILAEKFSVDASQICRVVNNKSWRELDGRAYHE